ncbi:MAG TPA: response regulator [Roseiflexaceae bacterium]|nr:response regulator [Roseiflexaceae bacterium]
MEAPLSGTARPQAERVPLAGLIFVVVLLLALITLPPLASAQAEALRARLDTEVQTLADALDATEDSMQEMQSAARAYVLTEEPAFLEQYRTAAAALPERLHSLSERTTRIDPALSAQVDEIAVVAQRWQREGAERYIALVQAGRANEAAALIGTRTTQAIFDAFRTRIGDVRAQIQTLESELTVQIGQARTLQTALTSGLGVLGLLAVGFVLHSYRSILALLHQLRDARVRADSLAQQARAERRRLQAVFDHSPEGMVVVDAPSGRLRLANPAAVALLGPLDTDVPLRSQPWVSRLFRPGGEPLPPDDLPLIQALEAGVAGRTVELMIEQPEAGRAPVLLTSVPLLGEGDVRTGVLAMLQDLRALRQAERLKSDFVALVSHELRTPLTAIQGCVQTMLRANDPPEAARSREFLHIIAEQGERLQELIDNLLSLSQVEAGALRLRRETVQPGVVLSSALRQLHDRLSGLRVQTDLPDSLPPVSADARRIEQVLLNLLDNARKFAPPGSLLTVAAVAQEHVVRISVCDQGPGVPAEARERIFERFYQIEQPTTRNIGGSGLGLAICKAVVEAHGGQIGVEDAPGGGAAFWFTLPAVAEPAPLRPVPRPSNAQPHVLVVDDDPALRRLLEASLPDAGYRVETAVEAQSALAAVARQPPDVILLDLMLPGSDGFELCRRLREWTDVPIIMLTARAAERDMVHGLELGADDYITKPFRNGELLARMAAVLRRARPEQRPEAPAQIEAGAVQIDLAQRRVRVAGAAVELTPTQFQILAFLARHRGQVLTHAQILREVWGEGYDGENHYLWVHIAHLRQKLEPDARPPRLIQTVRGVGYRFGG